jgi:nitroreductase/Pyruvate/2-oxoacid:ferredoxin oxidoreductase delta subunit
LEREVTTVVDREKCTGCGLCVKVCPAGTLTMEDGKAAVTGASSMGCGQCAAVCPADAVRVGSLDEHAFDFATIRSVDEWLPWGQPDAAELARLMRSRRSCRSYTGEPVRREALDDLARIGTSAPSATNSQAWAFTILPTRDDVMRLGDAVGGFFRRLSRLARSRFVRLFSRALRDYYRNYHSTVQEALDEWERTGRDRLFHGATAAIVVTSRPGASFPADDCLLATQNILLAAHAMGLGTCLIGFAVKAMTLDRRVARAIEVPDDESVHSVIALGHPAVRYAHTAGRRTPAIRYSSRPSDAASLDFSPRHGRGEKST